MHIPKKLPTLKWITILWGAYALAWIIFEGALWRAVVMGIFTTAVLLAHLLQKYQGGQLISARKWVALTTLMGFSWGLGSGLLVLFFMALKSGLHAHGPEFSAEAITWIINQVPLWTAVGLLLGLGAGLITAGMAATLEA